MRRITSQLWGFVTEYPILLLGGAATALLWANFFPESYKVLHDLVLIENFFIGHAHVDDAGHVTRTLTLHYLVNDVLMALFFAMAGKEVWEAVALDKGKLRGKAALTPLFATVGGMVGPVVIYLGIALLFGSTTFSAVQNGWAIPTATDIAFSYLVGRIVFGAGHPAVTFLTLLAIADDAGGLLIIAIFYNDDALSYLWLLLSFGSALAVYIVCNYLPCRLDKRHNNRRYSTWMQQTFGVWPYVIAGCLSWYGFQESGLHPALGLLPIIPTIPHASQDYGFFAAAEANLHDLLNTMEHALRYPVEIILLLFGLMNAGVQLVAVGEATFLVLAGLMIGKPLGILLFGYFAARVFKWGLPKGMRTSDLFVLGCVASIGFTVALFVASVAFDPGSVQDAARMGALLSLGAAVTAIVVGKLFNIQKIKKTQTFTETSLA